MSIAVLYGGNRPGGNTETLTKKVIEGIEVTEIHLKDYIIQPIEDKRHDEAGFPEINDDYNKIIDEVLRHDTLIFSTPIYWYTMTGVMKNFIDRWSHSMRDVNYPEFKQQMAGKHAYVVTVGGDNPYLKGLPLIQQFQYIFDFMNMNFQGYIIGEGNKPGDILSDKRALFAASEINKKLKSHV
ncbi:flavodoxin family protein [Priestia flexa]|jgi:multimeric flavodoxin WrbA|uniref:Flavodoxin family protein n=1 Tax=Priestia flexa TaxID=86664 RepID=A0A8I1MFZ9_9BACI|nr:flavodoxin family protein [Priestia flexa]MBN8252054.1 flavodoxin family protein [Priestia flexa]MBN8435001.1 flavodoxin family protein [Priestia flexa]MCA0967497.1 flavodoxin family protein [Priestia flexa]UIR31911.1 flavodoxin family protein [Priestia flexa]UZW65363.1 flavodoxin family protein [Priestia flexa]